MGAPAPGGSTVPSKLNPGQTTAATGNVSPFDAMTPEQLAAHAGSAAPTTGGSLPQQVQQAYGSALGQFGQLGQTGSDITAASLPYGAQAGSLYGQMGGMTPGDVTAGQLSTTDLSPYMNPYTQNVIDRSMGELNRQEGIQQQGVSDQFQRQNAFGGDRMALQKGVLGGEFGRVKGNLLADLYQKNFQNAQGMGQFDIGNRLQADTTNQGTRANLMGQGASGLGQLGLGGAQLGAQMGQTGAGGLGDLAGSGFQMANAANAAQVGAAQAQQQQQQQAIDAANANYARLLGIPKEYLTAMFGIGTGMGEFGTNKGSGTTNPGLLSQLSAGTGILGNIAGMSIG